MAFKLGDVIIDRLQFGYGAKSNGTALYALTQLKEASIDITADSTDITDKDGNLVYRKYSGKKGEVTAQNAFINLAVVETLSATDAEIATEDAGIVMPIITTVDAGKSIDITDVVTKTVTGDDGDVTTYEVVVNSLSAKGSMGEEYKIATGDAPTETEFAIKVEDGKTMLYAPTNADETQYIVKYKKTVYSGAKITNTGDKFPSSHELYFKALVVDPCDKESLRAAIVYIPSFMPSPEFSIALQGGDSQTMDYKGAMMLDTCSTNKELFSIYFIDEVEE